MLFFFIYRVELLKCMRYECGFPVYSQRVLGLSNLTTEQMGFDLALLQYVSIMITSSQVYSPTQTCILLASLTDR